MRQWELLSDARVGVGRLQHRSRPMKRRECAEWSMRQEALSSVQHRLSNSSVGRHFVEDAGGVGGQDVRRPHLHDPPLRKHHDSVARHDRR